MKMILLRIIIIVSVFSLIIMDGFVSAEESYYYEEQSAGEAWDERYGQGEMAGDYMGSWTVANVESWVSLREYPDTESGQVAKVPKWADVEAYYYDSNWFECYYNGVGGYIPREYLTDRPGKYPDYPGNEPDLQNYSYDSVKQVGNFAAGETNSVSIGEFARMIMGEDDQTDAALFYILSKLTFECNEWDILNGLTMWRSNAYIQLIDVVDETTSSEYKEAYTFTARVEDAVVNNAYTIRFDVWCSREYEAGEYYECMIQTDSQYNKLSGLIWTSRENSVNYVADLRPDGKIGIKESAFGRYTILTLLPENDPYTQHSYAYKLDYGGDYVNCFLYPDNTIYFPMNKTTYYPNGTEEQIKGVNLTQGNSKGATSSNLFNGGKVAMEENMMVYSTNNSVYRVRTDGEDEMCLFSGGQFLCSLNLINGECYFVCSGEGAYGYDLNGNQVFHQSGEIEHIVADPDYVFYTVSSDNWHSDRGVYCWEKSTGILTRIVDAVADNIAIDGEWVYYDSPLSGESLYRIRKDGSSHELILENKKMDNFIVEDGHIVCYAEDANRQILLYHCNTLPDGSLSPWEVLAYPDQLGGKSATLSTEKTKKIAVKDGWLYYYYYMDDSMICRKALDGSINEEFVCYTQGLNNGIFIFDNLMFLQGNGSLTFATVLDQ